LVDRIAIAIRQKGGFAPAAVGGPPGYFLTEKRMESVFHFLSPNILAEGINPAIAGLNIVSE
jgi:hypothetical protein